ncbi:MAG: hypothetical protein U9M90_04160 [Patescibacteria group bacterium]|nr:hypothetical protein [Patescibacteria group bacterium]
MINIFLIVYFTILSIFLFGALTIIYHLQAYQFNRRIAMFITLLFIVGFLIVLTVNVVNAIKVDWGDFPIVIIS